MLKSLIINLINLYQKFASQLRPHSPCRFSPTCSQYTKEAIVKYGILKGGFLGGKRILKCHPLSQGGIDPVK